MSTVSNLFGSGAKVIDTQTFTASGTWTKPASVQDTDVVVVDIWGPGGGGGVQYVTSSLETGAAGAGGAHNRAMFRASELSSSEAVAVGAGGSGASASSASAASGTGGGYSDFKGLRAYGGGGGGGGGPNAGGTGGGTLSAGFTNTSTARGGEPLVVAPNEPNSGVVTGTSQYFRWAPGEWGGGSNFVQATNYWTTPIHGGGGAVGVGSGASDRGSIWGGAAGGAYTSAGVTYPAGTSTFGGNGGAAGIVATNTANANGSNGSPRGGGGGAGHRGSNTGTTTGGNGGRGEVVITVYRGI